LSQARTLSRSTQRTQKKSGNGAKAFWEQDST
jgi:hypothetical protein